MMPGVNKRQMEQMMRRMGIKQQELDVEQVIIKCSDKEIIIDNPQVSRVNMMGQKTYQIVGEEYEKGIDTTPDINEEDISTVMEQANVSKEDAIKALEDTSGNLAEAIMKFTD